MSITIKEASAALGIDECSFYAPTTRYFKYTTRVPGKRETTFDLDGYNQEVELREKMISLTGLFMEYLHYEEQLEYKYIAQRTGIASNTLKMHKFGFDVAWRIAKAYRGSYEMERFDKYFGFK